MTNKPIVEPPDEPSDLEEDRMLLAHVDRAPYVVATLMALRGATVAEMVETVQPLVELAWHVAEGARREHEPELDNRAVP
jgi:hypothetical protein